MVRFSSPKVLAATGTDVIRNFEDLTRRNDGVPSNRGWSHYHGGPFRFERIRPPPRLDLLVQLDHCLAGRAEVCHLLIAITYPVCLFPLNRSAASILIGYWNSAISPAAWITLCMVVVIAINMLGAGACIWSCDTLPALTCGYRCIWRSRVRLRVRDHFSESISSIDNASLTDGRIASPDPSRS
jgi:hypothetical protein